MSLTALVKRSTKGARLTHAEGDANLDTLDEARTRQPSHDIANVTGSITPVIQNGNIQHGSVTGNFTLNVPSDSLAGFAILELTNDATGGYTADLSAYTIMNGASYDNTANAVNIFTIRKLNGASYLDIEQP